MATDLSALTGMISLEAQFTASGPLDLGSRSATLRLSKMLSLSFGTGENQANQIWQDRRILGGTVGETIDLIGTLKNAFGELVNMVAVKAIIIINRSDETTTTPSHSATDADMIIGDTGTAGTEFQGPFDDAGDSIKLEAGGMFCITNPTAAGWAAGLGASDLLYIKNNDAVDELMYDIVLIGESS